MEKQLTIIIITYNSRDIIGNCLNGIISEDFDIIIVDNASSDGTAEYILQAFPSVRLISSAKNIGFGRGCNLGIAQAKTPYILLLNPDVLTTSGAISNLMEKYEQYGRPCIMAPRTRKDKPYDGKKTFEKHPWVSGAVMLFEKSMIDKIGTFDENIFLFSEEVDLCKRAEKAGYDIVMANDIFMDHMVGGSSAFNPHISYMKYWHMGWSRLYYDAKHEPKTTYFKKTALSVVKYSAKLLLNLFSGNKNKYIKYKGLLAGTLSYLIGRKAFDAQDVPSALTTDN